MVELHHPTPIRPPLDPSSPFPSPTTTAMGKEREKSRITIHLDAPYVLIRGTSGAGANDAEPGFLSGHVCLYLAEATDFRAVTLHLRGKARVLVPPSESIINAPSVQTFLVYSHDWSFLDFNESASSTNSQRHTRTLKAGKHTFPFSVTLPPDLPSSLSADLHHAPSGLTSFTGGTRASVSYKLRATAARPSFSSSLSSLSSFTSRHPLIHILHHNLTTSYPVHVVRAPSPESLEYQQSVEVENTWPDKLMYSITLPHKAWATGDTILAVLRFSPLAKGVWVEGVVTSLWESVEVFAVHPHTHQGQQHLNLQQQSRKVVHQESRIIRCIKHEIVNGRAVRVDLSKPPKSALHHATSQQQHDGPSSSHHQHEPSTSAASSVNGDHGPFFSSSMYADADHAEAFSNHDVLTYITFPLPPMPYNSKPNTPNTKTPTRTPAGSRPSTRPPSPTGSFPSSSSTLAPGSIYASSSSTSCPPSPSLLVQQLPPLPGPSSSKSTAANHPPPFSLAPPLSPTHHLPPIRISHRLRLSILIHNRDGHMSELRCSLPVNILDGKVLFESREGGVALGARRYCVEGVVMGRRMAMGTEGIGSGSGDEEGESEVVHIERGGLGLGEEEGEEEDDLSQVLGFDDSALRHAAAARELGPVAAAAAASATSAADRDLPAYHAHLRDRVAVPGILEFGLGGAVGTAPELQRIRTNISGDENDGSRMASPARVQPATTLASSNLVDGAVLADGATEQTNANGHALPEQTSALTPPTVGRSRSPSTHTLEDSCSTSGLGHRAPLLQQSRPQVQATQSRLQNSASLPSTSVSSPSSSPSEPSPPPLGGLQTLEISKLARRHSHSFPSAVLNKHRGDGDRNRTQSHSDLQGGHKKRPSTATSLSSNVEEGGLLGQGGQGTQVRNLSSLIKATMKPFTSLGLHPSSSSGSSSSSSHGHGNHHAGHGSFFGFARSTSTGTGHPQPTLTISLPPTPAPHHHQQQQQQQQRRQHHRAMMSRTAEPTPNSSPLTSPRSSMIINNNNNNSTLGTRSRSTSILLSQVPTYTTATSLATYLGGVQPLTSLVGLPSYDDVVSVGNGTDGGGANNDIARRSNGSGGVVGEVGNGRETRRGEEVGQEIHDACSMRGVCPLV